jgi:hypothetical protein
VAYLLKARTVEPEKQPLVGNSYVTHTLEQLLEAVFSVWPMPSLCKEGQLPLRESLETAVRRVGGWCEMAASLHGCEPGSRRLSSVGRCYQAAQ